MKLTFRQGETEVIETTFELNDTLYARANVKPTEEVFIWLGVRHQTSLPSFICFTNLANQANIMLSYPIDEAETLLGGKLSTAKSSLQNCEEDLDFLREQITVRQPILHHVAW